jgi:hypothetical protein
MAKRLQENYEYSKTHDYFDGGAWTADMPEEIINQKPGKLNYAYSQIRSLQNRY